MQVADRQAKADPRLISAADAMHALLMRPFRPALVLLVSGRPLIAYLRRLRL